MNRILLRKPTRSFTKGKFRTKTMAMLLFFLFFSLASVRAQVAVTVTSGATNVTPNLAATYSSFANLTAALNNITAMTGAVNIQLSGGTEVAPPKGFTIGSTTLNAALTASAGNGGNGGININGIFVGYNNPSNTNLVGGVGTATGASASPDGILKLVGADYIGLTYISFIDPTTNTTPTTAMEFGVALFKASPTDGCQHNYIDTNFFTMQRLNTTVGSGPMIGEAAIIIVNSIPTAAITSITPTSNSGASTDNDIRNNDINGGANGISLYGYIAPAPYDFVDTRNSITGNYVRNFGGGIPATSSNGIITRGQWETDIEYNNVDNNDGFGVNQNSNLYGINVFNATNSNSITSNNVIKLQSGTTTGGQVYGIYNSINTGGNVPGFSTTINNNTIDMAQPLLTTAGNMRGINCISSSQILTISNNIISGLSPFAFTGNAYGIYTLGTATTTNITNNSIKNFNRTGTTGITYGILCQGTAATTTATTGPTNVVADGNTIDNLTFTATDNTGFVYGINAGVNTITNTINNNVVKNLAVGTSGSIYGIYDNGIAGTKVCQNNQVFNFSTPAGVGTSTYNSYYGIYYTNNAIAALNLDITGNSIYSLNNLGTGTNGDVYGIYCTALQPSSIYKNKIYDLSYNGTNTTVNGWVSGIFALNNVSTIYNNTIADLRMPNYAQPTQKLFGIRVGNANLYYNTVFLSGTNASSAALFSYTAGSLKLNNNIFINTVTPNSGGIATAYSRADTTINTYTASSNYNLFAGTNIYYDGTSTDATLAAYKTRMATRDQNSVTETTTPFISTVGSNPDFLRLPLNAISVANNNALPITSPAITTDYWGVTRSGTTPDIGASEFIGLVCTTPTVYTVTGGGNGCGSTGVPVGLSNSQTGVNYQLKLNGVATGGLVAGTGAALSFGNQTVAGTYTVDATSNVAGCTTPIAMSGNAIVTTSPAVNATSSQTNVSCNGGSNGTATVVASGGTAPFTYLWSPTGGTSATTTGRPVGAYTCTITDAVGCSTSRNFTITQPPAISTASWSQTNIACNGGSTGAASVSPSGGTAPYTYSWAPSGGTGASANGLVAGTYTVTVTDNNSCTATRNYTITQSTAVSGSAVVTNVACNGSTNGAINLTPSGGTPGYTYNWAGGITTEDRTGLAAGAYSVTITDANGCSAIRSFTVTQPTAVSGSGIITNNACNGGTNGAINLTPSGGTPGYTFNWGWWHNY
ncbi:beta strand repeat-containing protein [Flavobacterium sp.]|uniref:beta strand repeat-containing protein n=1 Tax=Flavobacterium sp. TaxID=239 RepID=UPI0038FCD7FA